MKRILLILAGALIAGTLGIVAISQATYAEGDTCAKLREMTNADEETLQAAGCVDVGNKSIASLITTIINIGIAVVGIISVGAIVIAGQRLVVSSGDSAKIVNAKRMIMTAVIALVIAGLAYAIVQFVIASVGI
jgi:hypothetical protein